MTRALPPGALPMSSHPAIAQLLAETTLLQQRAADPNVSAWVAANAGTGKTHVLTERVLRLLLAGTAPARILCLTYTKAAAAEMSKRVFDTLAGWVALSPDKLRDALRSTTGADPDGRQMALARTLFTAAIETPGGFKVQTIHSFAERLLQRFPLEAGVPPAFAILDDHAAGRLMREAIEDTLKEAASDRERPLGRALLTAIRYAADETFDDVLREAVANRALLDAVLLTAAAGEAQDHRLAWAEGALKRALSISADESEADIRSGMADILDDATIKTLLGVLSAGTTSEVTAAGLLRPALDAGGDARARALRMFLLTKEGNPRARIMVQATAEAHPELHATLERAKYRLHDLDCALYGLEAIAATLAIYRMAAAVRQRFETSKAARAALDFDDLIAATGRLLASPDGAAWVLYKLDGGIDHVLVDEAQDTSPDQWHIIGALVGEFFADTGAGAGAAQSGARQADRTVFAVGDEKQSIYSFQGAAPEMFAATGHRFAASARAAGRPWHSAALTLSFRTVAPVLQAVDLTFADSTRTPGLAVAPAPGSSDPAPSAGLIIHHAKRLGQAGLVEVWPPELPEPRSDIDAWSPLDEPRASSPVVRLAERIAATIRGWLDHGAWLDSEARPVRPGDILILVRKRAPVAPAIVAALKASKVPVAGADRIALSEQIGVQDLIALGDFLTLPEDDLALANVLKSPLGGLDDDDLLAIANGRRGTLWKALLDAGTLGSGPRFMAITETLKRWRKQADFLPPFEFFSNVLDRDGGRLALLERLGPEAADSIDEFMNLALRFDDEAAPSLTGFIAWLREDERTIKRDMEQGRDEVRIMTVHGAKGLEAPIVFLPDTQGAGGKRPGRLLMLSELQLPAGVPPLPIWPLKSARALPAIEAARHRVRLAEAEEANRLLYVAMTRPRDRLYVCGYRTVEKPVPGCWYETIMAGIGDRLVAGTHPDGGPVLRLSEPQAGPPERPRHATAGRETAAPRPAWISAPAPREARPAIPLAPSRLAPYDFDDSGEPRALPPEVMVNRRATEAAQTPPPPAEAGQDLRFLRGTLTHLLLEHLPGVPRAARETTARGVLDRRGSAFTTTVRQAILDETLRVLDDPVFAPLFGPSSRAEAPIVAELPDPGGRRPPLRINGQIDRLAVTDRHVLIVDFKTTRAPPAGLAGIPQAYILQLAAYRAALGAIYPDRAVRAGLLWTVTPQLVEIPQDVLDHVSSRLWELATVALDLTISGS